MWKIKSHIEIYNCNGSLWWPLAHPTPLLYLLLLMAQLPLPCRTALANGNLLIQKVLPPPTHRRQSTASEELIPGGKGQPVCLQQRPLCSVIYAPESLVNQVNTLLTTTSFEGSFPCISCFIPSLTGFSWELSLNTAAALKSLSPASREPTLMLTC